MNTVMLRQENGAEKEPEKDLLGLTYHNVAVLYLLQGQLDKAVEFSEKAIESKADSFGENHHLVAVGSYAFKNFSKVCLSPHMLCIIVAFLLV